MKLGLHLGYSGAELRIPVALVQRAEALGYDSVWTAEAYGSDAVTPLAYLAGKTARIKLGTAVMQIAARTPAVVWISGSVHGNESPVATLIPSGTVDVDLSQLPNEVVMAMWPNPFGSSLPERYGVVSRFSVPWLWVSSRMPDRYRGTTVSDLLI